MRVLFATAAPALPQMVGGSQHTSDTLIRNFIQCGHDARLLAGLSKKGLVGLKARIRIKVTKPKFSADDILGYPVMRAWHPWEVMGAVVKAISPDVIVVLAHSAGWMAKAAAQTGVPFVMAFQDVEFDGDERDLSGVPVVPSIANSEFTARAYREKYGFEPVVIQPVINAERYRTSSSADYITFINPEPQKGLEIALGIAAACPELPFLFVEGWPLSHSARKNLQDRLDGLRNVTFHESVRDMRTIYSKTRILLVPSQWQEGYGRVATEAQISGIPVVGSDRGGLPEAIGRGGIILKSNASLETWCASLRQLWNDDALRERLSELATRHAARPEMNNQAQIARWIDVVEKAGRRAPSP